MKTHQHHLTHARALLADIDAAPAAYLPRREALVEWLNSFVVRVRLPGYDLGATEAADLTAVHDYLRTENVPALAAARG